jgi:hypothetical protein
MKAKTLSGKLAFMLSDMVETVHNNDDLHRNLGKIRNLTSMAKAFGFGLQSSFESFSSIDDEIDLAHLADHFGVEEELVGDTRHRRGRRVEYQAPQSQQCPNQQHRLRRYDLPAAASKPQHTHLRQCPARRSTGHQRHPARACLPQRSLPMAGS